MQAIWKNIYHNISKKNYIWWCQFLCNSNRESSVYLLICILLLKHYGKSLQKGPHTRGHVQSHNPLLLQCRAAGCQHVISCHELHWAIYNQHILQSKHRPHEAKSFLDILFKYSIWIISSIIYSFLTFERLEQTATPTSGIQTVL